MARDFKVVDWAHHTNIYEVNIRQYTAEGTINAFAKELPRLKDMGVHTLWFMPLTPISKKNRKGTLGSYYSCSDYKSINPEFGTADDFRELVYEAHQNGFKVIIDWVANHTGWDHVWTEAHPEFYKTDPHSKEFLPPSGMEDIIELNYSSPGLEEGMIDAMRFWITEFDIDGFRCDLAAWVKLDFWRTARRILDSFKPLFWLGEFDELDNPEYGEVFDASYTWTWMRKTEEFYKNKLPLTELVKLLKKYDDLGDESMRVWFTSNHDENSWNGTEFEKYGDMAPLLTAFNTSWNGIPLIYSGQEIPNYKRLKFFDKDLLKWIAENQFHKIFAAMLVLHRAFLPLSGGDPAVQTNILKTDHADKVLAYLRSKGEVSALVILNFSAEMIVVNILDDKLAPDDPNRKTELPPWRWKVYAYNKS